MSWYTAGEILIWLILAAILGFVLGWLVHWLVSRRGSTSTGDELKRLRDENASLKTDLADCEQDNDLLQADLDACTEAKAALQTDLNASRALVATTASAVVAARAAVASAGLTTPAAAPVRVVVIPTSKDEAIAQVDAIAARTAGAEPAPKDDLEAIFGIGPVISKMLYKMKITSFRQVARFTPQDIATVEKALEFFPDRIVRDDWMSSARKLNIEKYGVDPCKPGA
ncbi:MAG: hypothetical protein FWF36_08575 [Propionibacteriaceae bacterium]|nr:hypothetical protein [Propionibacteriaceae bacterium]